MSDKQATSTISALAEGIIGSEIIKLAGEVNEKIRGGEQIYNLTIGDFNPKIFPIPQQLTDAIVKAYQDHETNYPPGDGMLSLREAVSGLLKKKGSLDYGTNEIVITGGGRPAIYAIFRTVVDPGEAIIFPVPSWNNNHYTYLNGARPIAVETKPENNFMPTAEELAPHISEAALLALCSPLNPTGTVFTREGLQDICHLVLAENEKRATAGRKPLYVLYDQIYWALTHGVEHVDPVTADPKMRPYTLFVDGISKSLAATGVRVGWTFGPKPVIDKMKSILSHIGAWAPKAEQVATAHFLGNAEAYDQAISDINKKLSDRLNGFYTGFRKLKEEGYPVEVIAPEAAMYLTVKFDLIGKKNGAGIISDTRDVTHFLLEKAKVAIVPFYAFGASEDSTWYRLSVGTCSTEDVPDVIASLRRAMDGLS